jgi:hypothetical protein
VTAEPWVTATAEAMRALPSFRSIREPRHGGDLANSARALLGPSHPRDENPSNPRDN